MASKLLSFLCLFQILTQDRVSSSGVEFQFEFFSSVFSFFGILRVLAQILQQSILEEPPDFDDEHGDGEAESAESAAEKGAGVWLAQSLPNLAAVQGISLGDLEAELGRLVRGVQMARRESALALATAPSVAGSSNGKLPDPMAEGVVVAPPSVSTSASVLETAAGACSHLALVVC